MAPGSRTSSISLADGTVLPPAPDLSIAIVGRGEPELLAGCLDSIEPGTGGLSVEVTYVDNGSTDGTPDLVRRRWPWVRVIENGANLGFARANNLALEDARGRYYLLINNDTRLVPGTQGALVRWMDEHPEAGAMGCRLVGVDGRVQHSVHPYPDLATEVTHRGLLSRLLPRRYPSKRNRWDGPADVAAVLGAWLLVRRETTGVAGLLDDGYFFYLEETDWCYRIRLAGWSVVYHPGFDAIHIGGGSAGRFPGPSRVELYRSRYRFFRKLYGRPAEIALHVGLVARLAVSIVGLAAANVATLGLAPRLRRRLATYGYLFGWHLAGRPEGWGIAR